MGHVLYANEPAVREEGSAQRPLCGLKMADGENSLGMAFAGASDMDKPVAKRPKMSPLTNYGFSVAKADQFPCIAGSTGSWEMAVNCAHPAGKEAKPAMAVEQATVALGGDNNGLETLVSEPHKPVMKQEDSAVLGTTEESTGMILKSGHLIRRMHLPVSLSMATHALTLKLKLVSQSGKSWNLQRIAFIFINAKI